MYVAVVFIPALDLKNCMAKIITLVALLACCLGVPSLSEADCSPEEFMGPAPGDVHVYENYSGGPAKVWGLSLDSVGVLTTLVEITVPPGCFPEPDASQDGQGKSYVRQQYAVSGSQILLKKETDDEILLDLCKDEWTFKANLLVGEIKGRENEHEINGQGVEVQGRILSRAIQFFQGKDREIVHVGYSFVNPQGELQSLGTRYFVEGLGCLLGDLLEFTRQMKAPPLELKKMRQLGGD